MLGRRAALAALLMIVFLAVGVAVAGAQARAGSPLIVCPLTTGGHLACCPPPTVDRVACCPVPTPYCACPATTTPCPCLLAASCTTGVTISSSANPSTAGSSVTVSGEVSPASAGATVELWEQLPGGSFRDVAQTTAASGGGYEFVRAGVQTDRQWYVTAGTARSATLSERVRVVFTVTKSLRIHVSPSHAGERISVQRLTRRGWKVIARPRLDRSSTTSVPVADFVRPSFAPTELRAVFAGDGRNIRTYSKAIHVVT